MPNESESNTYSYDYGTHLEPMKLKTSAKIDENTTNQVVVCTGDICNTIVRRICWTV